MKTVTVLDKNPETRVLTFDLRDILELLGPDVLRSRWEVNGIEALGGEAAKSLHVASDQGKQLDGNQLVDIASRVDQIIDGEFLAFLPGEQEPWIVVRAIDSSAYEVSTDSLGILSRIRLQFEHVEEVSE